MSKDVNNGQSRREFLGRSVAALAAASFLPSAFSCTGKSVAGPPPRGWGGGGGGGGGSG